jgi:hypothetical protein
MDDKEEPRLLRAKAARYRKIAAMELGAPAVRIAYAELADMLERRADIEAKPILGRPERSNGA